jgi:hypothetical protein
LHPILWVNVRMIKIAADSVAVGRVMHYAAPFVLYSRCAAMKQNSHILILRYRADNVS